MGKLYFEYGEEEVAYLKAKDKRLAEVIDKVGHINREVTPDLFPTLINSIVGQQISAKALATIWGRMTESMGAITPETVSAASVDELQSFGLSFRKAGYIAEAAEQVVSGKLDLEGLHDLDDDQVCEKLVAIKGIGVWTAEMLMIFSMQRQDIFSYGDLAIVRGVRMVHHHRKVPRDLFEKYRRRYSPYGSVASLYFWAVAGGAIEGMKDYAPKAKKR